MPIQFGLGAKTAKAPAAKPVPSNRNKAFGGGFDAEEAEEPEEDTSRPTAKSKSKSKLVLKPIDDRDDGIPKPSSARNDAADSTFADASSQRAAAKHMKTALEIDANIYDYDAAYDAIHARDAAKKAAEKAAADEGKSRYMDGLLASAEVRKRDQLRAREKVLQREREAEGEDFADKEKFVTGAYKQQQEQVKLMEEEEKRKDDEEERKRKTGGMQSFFKNVINEQEKRHQETTAAITEAEKNGPSVGVEQPEEKSATDMAKELNAKGGNVAINDDGQVVDRRELLSGGLNIVSKPSANVPKQQSRESTLPVYQGRNAGQKASRDRQTRMLEAQLEQAAKRTADAEAEEARELEHKAKSKKTDGDISSAKERYLARKKAAAAGNVP